MSSVIIVLGHKNDQYGQLSPLSIARCQLALDVLDSDHTSKVICTGGFGKNFNQTKAPHATYNRQYLIRQGVAQNQFLNDAQSRFTIEDATLTYPLLSMHKASKVKVISSDFHIPRVKLIFDFVMPSINKEYLPANSPISHKELLLLQQHEEFARQRDSQTLKTSPCFN
ncbi:YdcF family protein [Pseudoalteromonas luteoviolacea]|uniref:YdcF family protein n=1 Tax=Pseudoalteromonas luteoviolacea TaxID=43657 RepID=UPI001B396827|nr:YdcF family protein [Pseudoalteromonas luteoviolacea]MBQ4834785.1 YdcF family protein [Pseudoalteromonas luteoviolacea]